MSDLENLPPLALEGITIRSAIEADWPELCHLYDEVRREQFPWVDPASIREYDLYADAAGEAVHVLCHQGFPVGFVSVREPDRFIHHLYLARSFQGRGLGGLLLNFALATQPGPFRLKCVEENHRAARFYLRKGWIPPDGVSGKSSGKREVAGLSVRHQPARSRRMSTSRETCRHSGVSRSWLRRRSKAGSSDG